ncbi:MAG: heme-binding protein [Fuerstiella sp.]|nr:heme-binding protein [Fuerstiella sp.]MCP4852879.1 heme-binding protein [Fuerstiella sp.]
MSRFSFLLLLIVLNQTALAQTLEQQLVNQPPGDLAAEARESGDARRGAILFHQVHVGCVKCHAVDGTSNSLGPDLTKLSEQKAATDEYVVTSLLKPSGEIRKGYESITVVTIDGRTQTGLLVSRDDDGVVLRDPARNGDRITITSNEVDEILPSKLSIMPAGIVNQLGGRPQFLDLLRYLLDIRDGGLDAARKLQPPPGLIAFKLPEYESHVDHVGLIRGLDDAAFERGQTIYNRLCINCHGNKKQPGSLPTALRFAEGKFRSGGDPHTMYKTLTHGFGLMVPQMWMVPKQKYDVIHYIRESYVRKANESQYGDVTDEYLAALPKGDTFGPEPIEYSPWSDMNYGPSMINTFEVGSDGHNFAYKGIAVRLDQGPGGVSKGNHWTIFDHDTLRLAAAWSRTPQSKASGFISWQGIHFDGRHNAHPRIAGDLQFENPTGPGWANPATGSFDDNQRVVGRDGRNYGPLPRDWAKYRGLHQVGDQTIVEYSVADTNVLERFGHNVISMDDQSTTDVFSRNMSLGPVRNDLLALVATHPEEGAVLRPLTENSVVLVANAAKPRTAAASKFNGTSHLLIKDGSAFNMTSGDFSITARLRTMEDGTIFCKANDQGPWVPNGKTFFVRDGRLCYDIGWVGAVQSKKKVDDGQWHDVAMTWNHKTSRVTMYVDGKKNGGGTLKPKNSVSGHVAKIGFTSGNFPGTSYFTGDIHSVAFWDRELNGEDLQGSQQDNATGAAVAAWDLTRSAAAGAVSDVTGNKRDAAQVQGSVKQSRTAIMAGVVGDRDGFSLLQKDNRICLNVPSGNQRRNIAVWTVAVVADTAQDALKELADRIEDRLKVADLEQRIPQSGPARWPEIVATTPIMGPETGPFAIDVLSTPIANPWFARIRLTGHDFLADGDRVAVCSWDGDVWMVSGLKTLGEKAAAPQLKWQRIASGLFQPLGVKIVADDIYVTCRDQLVILRDRNGDGETDFYECFNSDHQVTEHFHEFAMGLQRDEIGNFYYAKSARHALKALVPHHGTLLRIPSNGSRTDILATGFRAANGVCLNPDGSFIVTDQEGHWNPKNRINWVREGGFYGNMFGYHDVTDDSDDAMEQPLCWITNAFDRSPAELMWIDNEAWGPLNGSLLNLSYGYGKVYVVPHEEIDGQMQGGMCQLPIPQFPTGTARGRISPHDNGLYLSGMFAWGSSQQAQEGGFYRLRYTGKASNMPVGLKARDGRLEIGFTDSLDAAAAIATESYAVKVWSLKRTANYGSKHYDEHELPVTAAELSADGHTVTLQIPELGPTWCMEIKCRLKSADGEAFERTIHNTIHRLP